MLSRGATEKKKHFNLGNVGWMCMAFQNGLKSKSRKSQNVRKLSKLPATNVKGHDSLSWYSRQGSHQKLGGFRFQTIFLNVSTSTWGFLTHHVENPKDSMDLQAGDAKRCATLLSPASHACFLPRANASGQCSLAASKKFRRLLLGCPRKFVKG